MTSPQRSSVEARQERADAPLARLRPRVVARGLGAWALRMAQHQATLVGVVLALGAAGVVGHASRYGFFVTDDAFISFRYTERLLDGKGLTWTDYEPVEGYSNLLWVLLCAIPGALGVDLVTSARLLGLASTVALFGALFAAAGRLDGYSRLAPAAGVAMLALSGPVGVWAMGGLETMLACALLAWGVVSAMRVASGSGRSWRAAALACFGLLCWTRPDGFIFALLVTPGLILGDRRHGWATARLILLTAVAAVAAQVAFRVAYYADWVPNTAYAKVAFGSKRLGVGLGYIAASLVPLAATWLSFPLVAVVARSHPVARRATPVLIGAALGWAAYVALVGGDTFPAWRQLAPIVTLGALGATLFTVAAATESAGGAWRVIAVLLVLTFVGTRLDPGNWASAERWQWDGRPVGTMLGTAFGGRQPLVAVDAAGTIPFYSRLPALDMLGLNDRYLAHHRPASMGAGSQGHELGDPDYFLSRAPDLYCFGVPPCTFAPITAAEHAIVRRKEFSDHYLPVRIASGCGRGALVSELWVRLDGRIGIEVSGDSLRIPSYLFATAPTGAACHRGPGFTTPVARHAVARSPQVRLASGTWSVEVPVASGARGTLAIERVSRTQAGERLAAGPLGTKVTLQVPQALLARVVVVADTPLEIDDAVLRSGGDRAE